MVGNHITLGAMSARVPGSRLLEGSFYGTAQAMEIAKGRPAGSKYAGEFIENAKTTGFVKQAIEPAVR